MRFLLYNNNDLLYTSTPKSKLAVHVSGRLHRALFGEVQVVNEASGIPLKLNVQMTALLCDSDHVCCTHCHPDICLAPLRDIVPN